MSSSPPPRPVDAPAPPAAARPRPPRKADADVPPWHAWTLAAVLSLGFGLWVLATVVVAIAARGGGSSLAHPSSGVNFAAGLGFDMAFVVAVLYFTVVHGGARAVDFGYRRVSPVLAVGAVVTAAVAYYLVTALYAELFALHGRDKLPSNLGVIGAPLFVCVIAPIAEEFVFRGYLFGTLRRMRVVVAGRELGTWLAAVITGILFGLVHTGSASPQYLIPLGFLGFVLCLLRWRTGSLYPCMALHSINNSLALGLGVHHWSFAGIAALMVGALLVIAAVTGPLAGPRLETVRASQPDD